MNILRSYKWQKIIKNSGLFDATFYLVTYPDLKEAEVDPVQHFVKFGADERRNPSAEFDLSFYLDQYADVRQSGINPLVHYIVSGRKEGRLKNVQELYCQIIKKSKLFDAKYYFAANPDLLESSIDPIWHYVYHGAREGRNPSPDFDTTFYLNQYADVRESEENPFVHYIVHGKKHNRFPNRAALEAELARAAAKVGPTSFVDYKKNKPIEPSVKLIAFYLPQFHPFPENDEWWGKGFTEWTNVGKALPNYVGHYQPHCPIHCGYYDLRVPSVMEEQAKLAKEYGIYGFSYYFYWFDGKILMDTPLEMMLANKKVDMPFCFTWANENWSRRWDGQEDDILIKQNHSDEDSLKFIRYLVKYFKDERYIRIDDKPVLIIYRADIIPNLADTVKVWRDELLEHGISGLYLMAAQSFGITSPAPFDFNASVEFPPHTSIAADISAKIDLINPQQFNGKIYDYKQVVDNAVIREEPDYKLFRSTMLSWDNTARKQHGSHIFCDFSLEEYSRWLSSIVDRAHTNPAFSKDEKIVFINAWNEWAEGTHLEPDQKYGYGYLQSTYDVVQRYDAALLAEKKP